MCIRGRYRPGFRLVEIRDEHLTDGQVANRKGEELDEGRAGARTSIVDDLGPLRETDPDKVLLERPEHPGNPFESLFFFHTVHKNRTL